MKDCLFCQIANKEIPKEFVYEDDEIVAFDDVKPSAKVHILVIPRKHIVDTNNIEDGDQLLVGRMILVARDIAKSKGIADSGYKLVINCGEDGGQMVPHLHLHVLGGERISKLV